MKALHERSEWELIANSRDGDKDAMAELFRRHYPSSVRVARGILTSYDDSLDVVQSAYLSAFRHFDSFRGQASFKTWITRIVVNQCLMHIRALGGRGRLVSLEDLGYREAPLPVVDWGPNPEDLAGTAEIRRAVAEAAGRLPKHLREVFMRCGIAESSLQDTAHVLGLTVAGTKTRFFRARSRMRPELKAFRPNALTPRHACFAANLRSNGI